MSEISRWSYTNTATVTPFVSEDRKTGAKVYGEPYDIACTWTAEAKEYRGSGGAGRTAEFISNFVFFTEDARPKYRDRIARNGYDESQEILLVLQWDMSMFDGDVPDYKLVT